MIWGEECDPSNTDVDDGDHTNQKFVVVGTGPELDNFTVIMDFWDDGASPYNILCLYPDFRQGMPGSGECTIMPNFSAGESCLTATDIIAARAPGTMPDATRVRGGGCKDDGGPLWVTVELVDDPVAGGSNGGGDVPRTVWARLFQKEQLRTTSRRSSRYSSRYAQVADLYPTETKDQLVECMALQLCTATGAP